MNFIANLSDIGERAIGRIGGNIPELLIPKSDQLKNYNFYMTFQNYENKTEYLSIFIHKSFDVRVDENIYPNIAVIVFQHSYSNESNLEDFTSKELNKCFIAGYEEVDDNEFGLITFSKSPKLIQEEDYYFDNLRNENFNFFLQIDEDFYSESTLRGNYIFAYGALYLFKQQESEEVIAGFWQH